MSPHKQPQQTHSGFLQKQALESQGLVFKRGSELVRWLAGGGHVSVAPVIILNTVNVCCLVLMLHPISKICVFKISSSVGWRDVFFVV